jgi:hypothetical protein
MCFAGKPARLHFELLAQRPFNPQEAGERRGVDVLIQPKPDQVSTLEERSLLSFQRPVPVVLTA